MLESVEAGRKTAIEALRKFVDEVTPVIADQSRRKTVIDAALDLAEELVTARVEFLRSVVRSAGETFSKEWASALSSGKHRGYSYHVANPASPGAPAGRRDVSRRSVCNQLTSRVFQAHRQLARTIGTTS